MLQVKLDSTPYFEKNAFTKFRKGFIELRNFIKPFGAIEQFFKSSETEPFSGVWKKKYFLESNS